MTPAQQAHVRAHQCFHCKQWIEAGQEHDCWTTTEAALTRDLPEDLRDAWARIRETALEFGDQRIYASHHSIMFARKACYFFVRPKMKHLEVVIFLGRSLKSPLVHSVLEASKTKRAHIIRVVHRDQVEPPVTDWMKEAYQLPDIAATRTGKRSPARTPRARRTRAPRRDRSSRRRR